MSAHPADPPTPIPSFLAPMRAPLGEYDLRIVVTARELTAIVDVLRELELDPANAMITHRDGSPWIEVDVVRAPEQALTLGEITHVDLERLTDVVSLALWRYTCAVYRVGRDGAVEDDPIYRPADHGREPQWSRSSPPAGGSAASDDGS